MSSPESLVEVLKVLMKMFSWPVVFFLLLLLLLLV